MVILVDSSVWVAHFRKNNRHLAALLHEEVVAIHPFVIGELACGHLHPRREILSLLHALPQSPVVNPSELLHLIERHHLPGSGIGFVDAHLLASSELMRGMLWTADRPLQRVADKLDLSYT
jgi:predicted nucleic acid-binding protein